MNRAKIVFVALLVVLAVATTFWFLRNRRNNSQSLSQNQRLSKSSYVDNQICAECHQKEFADWTGSDHEQAMQLAAQQTVRGDFNNSTFTNYGVTSRFFNKDGKYFINTEGPDGRSVDFEIKYTFGIRPLQQYLVEFPGGRLQALGIAWDTNKNRWFHLYPNERVAHEDPLHWTKLYQNWNMMCADCHSTNLRKNYDSNSSSYMTAWDAISVSCQSCHGPGSAHVDWARRRQVDPGYSSERQGLVVNLKSTSSHDQVDACLPCHSRRTRLTGDDWVGKPYLDSFLPALLTPELYHTDGQILDEDYEYGSFLQSKMYQDGIGCVDCHNPHTLKLKAEGNTLCVRCHSERGDQRFPKLIQKVYDTPEHHFHKQDSEGALCVNCHMAAKNYMVVDLRRDHSFRIPRPDLSVKIGTPNACNSCHKDKSAQWAADMVAKWYGPNRRKELHYGEIIAAGRSGKPEAESQLVGLVRDANMPAIVRATALELLGRNYGQSGTTALVEASADRDALVRSTAVAGLLNAPSEVKLKALAPLLRDPIRAVRIQAARGLVSVSGDLNAELRAQFNAGLGEFRAAQMYNADTPAGNLNLALLDSDLKQFDSAIGYYEMAVRLDPEFMPARVNLGNLFNQLGRNEDAERVYREAIKQAPDEGELHYSLGLLLAEENRLADAVAELGRAAGLLNRGRVYYNYALALQHSGKATESEAALLRAYSLSSNDPDILNALAIFYAQQRKWDQALSYAQRLMRLQPGNDAAVQLVRQIETERGASRNPK